MDVEFQFPNFVLIEFPFDTLFKIHFKTRDRRSCRLVPVAVRDELRRAVRIRVELRVMPERFHFRAVQRFETLHLENIVERVRLNSLQIVRDHDVVIGDDAKPALEHPVGVRP